jgi:hypothetical protein
MGTYLNAEWHYIPIIKLAGYDKYTYWTQHSTTIDL